MPGTDALAGMALVFPVVMAVPTLGLLARLCGPAFARRGELSFRRG